MMQRLIRGRFLYVLLGLLTFLLYVWVRPVVRVGSFEVAHRSESTSVPLSTAQQAGPTGAERVVDSLDWWPQELDRAAFQELATQQPHLAVLLKMLAMCGLGLGAAGLVLSLRAIRTGGLRAVWHFTSRRLPSWSFGELGRITFLLVILAALVPFLYLAASSWESGAPDVHLRITVSMIVLDVCAIIVILGFAAGKGRSVWRTLGLSGRTLARSIGVGLRGYVTMFPWLFLTLFLVAAVARALGIQPPMEPIQELVFEERRPLVLGLTVLLACVIGPVAEECFFRGVVYPAIRRRTSWVAATLISGALFALLHANPVGFLSILLLGCLLANLYERTGSLAAPLAVHVLHNTLLISTALVFRQVVEFQK